MSEPGRWVRERREADARYNDALTALDRALAAASSQDAWSRDDAARLATALIVYLQQITAFVESKDRELASSLDARLAPVDRALESVAEIRTQVATLRRITDALTRQSQVPSLKSQGHDAPLGTGDMGLATTEIAYVGFEDEFRGSDEDISTRLAPYVEVFRGATDVLDIGCGRGELLGALKAAGVSAKGVDANGEMAAIARGRGLDAVQGDALAYLVSRPDATLGGIVATQVVEHLEPEYLMRLIAAAAAKLRPGAPIVLETINAACWLAFFSSYIRDLTHVRPLHPETLQYLLRASSFERVEIRYSAPVPAHMKMATIDLSADVLSSTDPAAAALSRVAHTLNANAVILNNLMFTHLDYAAVGWKPSMSQ